MDEVALVRAYGLDPETIRPSLTAATDLPPTAVDNVPGDVTRCRVCGCTDDVACDGGCWWVVDPWRRGPLCSACLEILELGDVLGALP